MSCKQYKFTEMYSEAPQRSSGSRLLCGLSFLIVTLALLLVALLACMLVYQVQMNHDLSVRIAALELNDTRQQQAMNELQVTMSKELELCNLKVTQLVESVRSCDNNVRNLTKLVENNRENLMATNEKVDCFQRAMSNVVNSTFASTDRELQLAKRSAETQTSVFEDKLQLERQNAEKKIRLVNERIDTIEKEQLSLHSQVHHPTTVYSNCRADIHNSTCDIASANESGLQTCVTDRVPREVEEKVLTSQANGEVRALKDRLATYQNEVESYQRRLTELSTLREQLDSLRRDYRDLGSKFEMSEQERMHLNGLKKEVELKYRELVETLQHQLRRSKLLQQTLDDQVTGGDDVRERIETLLQQEQLHLLTHDSLQADKEQLERQIRGLKKEIEDWKHLAKTAVPDLTPAQSSQLFKSRSTDAASETASGYEQAIEHANSKIARLYAQYRQAESHRKALVFQKRYLLCQVDAFYQTQQAALQMMSDMGAPIEATSLKPSLSKVSRPCARFKTVGRVVMATLRFRYVRRRKIEYLQSKMSKLSPSPSNATTFGFSPLSSTHGQSATNRGQSRSALPSQVHPVPSVALSNSSQPRRQPVLATSLPSSAIHTTGLTTNAMSKDVAKHTSSTGARFRGQSVPTAGQLQPTAPKSKSIKKTVDSTSSRGPGTISKHRRVLTPLPRQGKTDSGRKATSKKVNPLSIPSSSQVTVSPSPSDPQLMAYMKGLERLQARLSKTKV